MKRLVEKAQVSLEAFVADINDFRLTDTFDVIFPTGVLQENKGVRSQHFTEKVSFQTALFFLWFPVRFKFQLKPFARLCYR